MKIFNLLVLLLLLTFNGVAQKSTTNPPKVGVVLSGGGAKGLAHIGVLKVIDSLGLKVDYIAGSSMGAVIGGLYASGYNAKQLDSIFHTVDFERIIQGKIPRNSKTFYEKDDAAKYALTLPMVNGKITLPKGISNGQNLYNFYSKVTTHVHEIEDFSKLPVPFFCTATDLETGETIIFDKGKLPEVVLASGALPSLYSPVNYKGKLLTDGGVSDNYPVEIMRKHGVDFVIGVDVQSDLMTKDELNSVTDIMLQVSNFRTVSEMEQKVKLTDIYIKPDIKGFSVVGFNKGKQIVKLGESKALAYVESFNELKALQKVEKVSSKAHSISSISIKNVIVENNKDYSDSYIKGKIGIRKATKVTLDKLNKGLDDLYATKNFHSIRYEINKNGDGNDLLLRVNESNLKSFFRFGLHHDDLYKSAIIMNYTRKKLLFKNDKFSFDGVLGDFPRYDLKYYIDKGNYWDFGFVNYFYQFEFNSNANQLTSSRFIDDFPVNDLKFKYRDLTTQFYLETLLNETFALKIGVEHKWLSIRENDFIDMTIENASYLGLYSDLRFDTLDSVYFPTKGVYFNANLASYALFFSTVPNDEVSQLAILKSSFKYVKSVANFSFQAEVGFGARLGSSEGLNTLDFFIGGFGSKTINNQVPFYGRDFYELSGDSYVKSAFTADYNFWKNHHLNITANYANIGRRIFNIEDWFQRVGFSGYAVGYGYESIIGPLQVKYAFSTEPGTDDQLFLSLGYWF